MNVFLVDWEWVVGPFHFKFFLTYSNIPASSPRGLIYKQLNENLWYPEPSSLRSGIFKPSL